MLLCVAPTRQLPPSLASLSAASAGPRKTLAPSPWGHKGARSLLPPQPLGTKTVEVVPCLPVRGGLWVGPVVHPHTRNLTPLAELLLTGCKGRRAQCKAGS